MESDEGRTQKRGSLKSINISSHFKKLQKVGQINLKQTGVIGINKKKEKKKERTDNETENTKTIQKPTEIESIFRKHQ